MFEFGGKKGEHDYSSDCSELGRAASASRQVASISETQTEDSVPPFPIAREDVRCVT